MILAAALWLLAACADDPTDVTTASDDASESSSTGSPTSTTSASTTTADQQTVPPTTATATSTTTDPPEPVETTYPTTAPLVGTPTTSPPTVTYPAVPPPSPLDGFTDFAALPVPAGIPSCGFDDVWAREEYVLRSDFDYRVVHLINTSPTACGLEIGAVDEQAGAPVTNRVRGTWEPADPVLAPGAQATVVLTSTAEAQSGLEPITLTVGGVAIPHELMHPVSLEPVGLGVAGPVVWTDPRPTVAAYFPTESGGVPVDDSFPVTLDGVGAFRPGLGLQAAANATGQTIIVHDWNQGSTGCGHAFIVDQNLRFYLEAPVGDGVPSPDDATIVAIEVGLGFVTDTGLAWFDSAEDLAAAYDPDTLSFVPNEYGDERHVRYRPTPDSERALFFPLGEVGVHTIVTGFAESVSRAEGCA